MSGEKKHSAMSKSPTDYNSKTNSPSNKKSICNQHSRHSDAGLPDHLGAQIFRWQFKGAVQKP